MKYKIQFKTFLFGFIILIFIGAIIASQVRRGNIMKHQAFAVGKIIHINENYYYKTGRCFRYSFVVNGKEIIDGHCESSLSRIFKNEYYKDKMMNQNFPVIYNSENLDNHILIFKSDFKSFNLSYPDSLSWTERYLKDVE